MAEQCYVGIDLGAESGRVMAGLWDGQRMRLDELHRFPNGPVAIAGTIRWDVLRLWSEIENGLRVAAQRYGNHVISVGVDTWGVDYVLLSRHGELLGQPWHYRDRRTGGLLDATFQRVPRRDIFAATGLQFMEINTLFQLIASQQNTPELLEHADCLLMIPDFFHWCLCGSRVVEFTNATTTQCFHPTRRQWSVHLLEKLGLPARIFPPVVPPGTNLGTLLDSVSQRTGLRNVSVVTPATHDTGSAVAAVPTRKTGWPTWAYISSGTWSLMGVEVQNALLSDRVLDLNLTNEGGVNFTYRLLKNVMGLWLVQQCKRSFELGGKDYDYATLVRLASEAGALRSLIDPDDARFLNPADMPTAIQAYCRETGQPVPESEGALVRCTLESLALKYHVVLGYLEEVVGGAIDEVHIVGGGSRNELLNQFAADACARLVLAGPVEATILGNLLVQTRASGESVSLKELRSIVADSAEIRPFEPDQAAAAAWSDARDRFARLLARPRS